MLAILKGCNFLSKVGGFLRALWLSPAIKTGLLEVAQKWRVRMALKHQLSTINQRTYNPERSK